MSDFELELEEIAAMTAVVMLMDQQRRAVVVGATTPDPSLRAWVSASRLRARSSGMLRGPWRLSGRIARRSRA